MPSSRNALWFGPAMLVLIAMCAPAPAQCTFGWTEGFGYPGASHRVWASAVYDDGNGPALYLAGRFRECGGVSANYVARWDGRNWTPLGAGTYDDVRVLAVYDDGSGPALYAAGEFTGAGGLPANYIARWNGNAWSPLGEGVNNTVNSLAVYDDGRGPALYAGGQFTAAGGAAAGRIARWDGQAWSNVGTGMSGVTFPAVCALTTYDDGSGPALLVGGKFTYADGVAANNVAKWDGATWSPLGSGILGDGPSYTYVRTLGVWDDGGGAALYAGGTFLTAGGAPAANIAEWDGTAWSPLGDGTNGSVGKVIAFRDGSGEALFVGGSFSSAAGTAANCVAKWEGTIWSPLGSGMGGMIGSSGPNVFDLTVFNDGTGPALFAAGDFRTADQRTTNGVSKWDGAGWQALGQGVHDWVFTAAVFDDGGGEALYVGGDFTEVGGTTANHIAKWDGGSWSRLDTGVDAPVFALTVFDDGTGPALYAGGFFLAAGGVTVHSIAKWDGAQWSALGSGAGSTYALAVFDDGRGPALYAAGSFTAAGGNPASRIARWDGISWSPLGSGLNDRVNALAVFDDGAGAALYAAGDFATAGGVSAARIARWDGANWTALGQGLDNDVNALAVFDDGTGPQLYVGGDFRIAGLVNASRIAAWNGTSWSRLGIGVSSNGSFSPRVSSLFAFDDGGSPRLYAGGSFTYAGGYTVNHIAAWDGTNWSALGAGMNGSVWSFAEFQDEGAPTLYAVGNFTLAGQAASSRIARWAALGPDITQQPESQTVATGQPAGFTVYAAGTGGILYQWRKDGQDLVNGGRITGATTNTLVIDPVEPADAGRYDCVLSDACATTISRVAELTIGPAPCPGDLNGDRAVDLVDLGILLSDFGCTGGNCVGDVDGDGDTDLADLGILLANFGRVCP